MNFYNCEETETKLYKSKSINVVLMVLLIISLMFNFKDAFAVGLYAKDGTYLGEMTSNPYDANSINNPYGKYGSPYSPSSIKNPYSKYGSPYSTESVNNPYLTPTAEQLPSVYE
jgi:hypothetical protein